MGMVIGGLFVHAVDRKCVVNTFLDCLSGTLSIQLLQLTKICTLIM